MIAPEQFSLLSFRNQCLSEVKEKEEELSGSAAVYIKMFSLISLLGSCDNIGGWADLKNLQRSPAKCHCCLHLIKLVIVCLLYTLFFSVSNFSIKLDVS